jgi:hypothetical protein
MHTPPAAARPSALLLPKSFPLPLPPEEEGPRWVDGGTPAGLILRILSFVVPFTVISPSPFPPFYG